MLSRLSKKKEKKLHFLVPYFSSLTKIGQIFIVFFSHGYEKMINSYLIYLYEHWCYQTANFYADLQVQV